jgi:tetratricopeptide (TPR) repeat protein
MKRLGILWRRFLRVLLALVSAAIICFCAGSSLSQSVQHPHTPAGSSSTLVNVQELAMPPKAFRAYQKGSELLRKHESQASLVHFQRAIQLAPGLFPAYHNLALAFFELGRLDDALKNFQKAIELSKGSFAPSFFTLAMILYQRGQFAEAQGIVQQGLLADPQSAVGRYSLGLTQYSLGQTADAQRNALEALRIDPQIAVAYLLLAHVHERLRDPNAVIADVAAYSQGTSDNALQADALALLERAQRDLARASVN